MKKYLLGGVAGAVVSMAVISGAMAEESTAAKLTISGTTTFQVAGFKQDGRHYGAANPSDKMSNSAGQGYGFSQEDSSLTFSFHGQTEDGLDYLGVMALTGQPGGMTQNNTSTNNRVRQAYVQLKKWGVTVQGGNTWGTEITSVSDASYIMGGDGGFGSNWSSRFNEPFNTSGSTGNMLYSASLLSASMAATKMTVFTPRFMGLQLGMSLTPNTGHFGDMSPNSAQNPSGKGLGYGLSGDYMTPWVAQNHQAYSLTFNDSFGDWSVSAAGSFVTATQTKASDRTSSELYSRASGWTLGSTVSWKGFSFGGGYYDNKKTGTTRTQALDGRDGGKVWNVGAGYSFGAYAVAVGYLNGSRKLEKAAGGGKAKSDVYSVTADCRLADGLTVYADVNYAKMTDDSLKTANNNDTIRAQNKGTVMLLGTRVSF